MKLSQVMTYINQNLNYPAITYEDVSLFFDAAISELNTSLHTQIPSVSKMREEYRKHLIEAMDNEVIITQDAVDNGIPTFASESAALATNPIPRYYYNSTLHKFGIYSDEHHSYVYHNMLYGIVYAYDDIKIYQSYLSGTTVLWVTAYLDVKDVEFETYLPEDWVILWLIPYVCFKYSVRDGGASQVFADEITQGFQQLQDTYNVPTTVTLAAVADKLAYYELVQEYKDTTLLVAVRTRAIYENYKHERSPNAIYGSVFDRGGFGI